MQLSFTVEDLSLAFQLNLLQLQLQLRVCSVARLDVVSESCNGSNCEAAALFKSFI